MKTSKIIGITIATLGIAFSCIMEAVVFYVLFRFIRIYAGGYHAKSETRCEIMSVLSIFLCILIIKWTRLININSILLVVSMISSGTIILLCPLDTPEKPLTKKEFHKYRKIALLILLFISVIIIVSYIFEFKRIFAPSCLSLILESILLSAGKTRQLISKKYDGQ